MREPVNILMVDDQPGKLLSYEAMLADLKENLIAVRSGNEVLKCILKADVAVVLMDVNMPELDGFRLADMIRDHPRSRDTAIIFISAVHLTDLDRLQGYGHGGVDYISVPVIPELLRAKVKVFAELHRKTRQLERLNSEMQSLTGRIITAQDEERRRIARELHDCLGQELVAAKMAVAGIQVAEAAGQVADASELIDNAIKQVRSISYLLHPPLLEDAGLQSAIQSYLDGLSKRSGILTSLETQPCHFPRLEPTLETTMYRVVQEALTNVFRHSGAREAWVTLTKRETEVLVKIRDDGRGVAEHATALQPGSIGVGMAGMMQRVKEVGGELRLENVHPGTLMK